MSAAPNLNTAPEAGSSAPHTNPWKDPSILGAMKEFGKALHGVSDAALGKDGAPEHPAPAGTAPDAAAAATPAGAEAAHGHGHAAPGGSKKKKTGWRKWIPGDEGSVMLAIQELRDFNKKRKEGNLSQHDVSHLWKNVWNALDWDILATSVIADAAAGAIGWFTGIPEHAVEAKNPDWENLGGQVMSFVEDPQHHFHHDVHNLCRGFANGWSLTTRFRNINSEANFRRAMGSASGRDAIKAENSRLFNMDKDLTRDEVETMTTEIMRRWGADITDNGAGVTPRYTLGARHHTPRNRQDDANHAAFAQLYVNAMNYLDADTLNRLYPLDKTKVDINYKDFGVSIDTQVQTGTTRETFLENLNPDAFRATFTNLLNPTRLQTDLATPEGREELKAALKNLCNLKPTAKLNPAGLANEFYEILRTHTPGTPAKALNLGGFPPAATVVPKLGARPTVAGEAQTHFDALNDMLVTIYNNLNAAPPTTTGVPTKTGGVTYASTVESLYHSSPKVMDLGLGKMPQFGQIVLGLDKADVQDEFLRGYSSTNFRLYFGPLLDKTGVQKDITDATKRATLKNLVANLVGNDTVSNGPRLKSFVDHFTARFNPTRLAAGSPELAAHTQLTTDLNAILNELYTPGTPPVDLVQGIANGPEKKSLYENMFGKIAGAKNVTEIGDLLNEFTPMQFGSRFPILAGTGASLVTPANKVAARDECDRLLGLDPSKTPPPGEVTGNIQLMIDEVASWLAPGHPVTANISAGQKATALRLALSNVQTCLTLPGNYDAIFI